LQPGRENKLTRRQFLQQTALAAGATVASSSRLAFAADSDRASDYPVGALEPVASIRQRPEWNRFVILVWQFQNDVRRDTALYEKAGLHGFHIDRGAGEDDKIRFSVEKKFPYYVDHAAGKGILYLQKDVQQAIMRKAALQPRPHSLADPKSIDQLKSWLRENVATTKKGLVYGYAFDDEISLGAFNNPVEVDTSPQSLAWYRKWLARRYGSIAQLNGAWSTEFRSFDAIQPVGFDDARKGAARPPLSQWNLSQWLEWRHFMDYQFAQVLADLTRFTNSLDASIPAGFVGAQQPSAYGGFDYALLGRAVQWMEASDFGGTNEVLRSFWSRPRRPQVQTFDARFGYQGNVWTLWQRLAHGQQAAIAWPEGWFKDGASGGRELSSKIEKLAPVFREIQGRASEFILNPDAYLDADPIGLYYSHPSIRAGWAIDAIAHGSSWPNRLTSMDDDNLSSARLRYAWCKLLEDLGYQYDFISYLDVQEGRGDLTERFKVIILPQTICLADREAQALRLFVRAGGMLIADSLCGVLNETGRGRNAGALDDVFGIARDETRGYFNGQGITEVDAEKFQKPFPERLQSYQGAWQFRSMIVHERGIQGTAGATVETAQGAHVLIRRSIAKGRALYLNLTPLAYSDFSFRSGAMGASWREIIGKTLRDSGLRPRVEIDGASGREPWMECLLWRNGARCCLALLKNAAELLESADSADGKAQQSKELTIRLNFPARNVRNVRTGKSFGTAQTFKDQFVPWEANLYEFGLVK
jgi:hypothetical protein